MSERELTDLYTQEYYEGANDMVYRNYLKDRARKSKGFADKFDAICRENHLTSPGTCLEIGCAYGYFLDEARQRGWQVRGVEPSAHAAREARSRFGLEVSEQQFTELPAEPGSLDAVVLWDVIEHLPNPRETLEAAWAWLRPGGLVAISTGDVDSLSARLHGRDWSLMTPPWHQFYFSRQTMRRMLREVGFDVVRVGGDGSVAVDPASPNPRVTGPVAALLERPVVTRIARKLGAGSIMFAFACKAPR